MAEDHRRSAEKVLQGVLLDEPDFLREIVSKRVKEVALDVRRLVACRRR